MNNDIISRYGKRDIHGYLIDDIIEDGLFNSNAKNAKDWDLCVIDHSDAEFFNVFALNAVMRQCGESRTLKCISDIFEPDESYWRLSDRDRCQKKARAFGMKVGEFDFKRCTDCLKYCIENKKKLRASNKKRHVKLYNSKGENIDVKVKCIEY